MKTTRHLLLLSCILLLLPAAGFAQTEAECTTRCAAEKASRDAACPPAGEETGPAHDQCVQESQESFNSCVAGCLPAEPAEPPQMEKAE
jgi:hypothetical protein